MPRCKGDRSAVVREGKDSVTFVRKVDSAGRRIYGHAVQLVVICGGSGGSYRVENGRRRGVACRLPAVAHARAGWQLVEIGIETCIRVGGRIYIGGGIREEHIPTGIDGQAACNELP